MKDEAGRSSTKKLGLNLDEVPAANLDEERALTDTKTLRKLLKLVQRNMWSLKTAEETLQKLLIMI